MTPECISGATSVYGAPRGWDQNGPAPIGALHVKRVVDPDIGVELRSAWRPTPEELAILNAGGVVILNVVGDGHPPVALWAEAVEERQPTTPAVI